MRGSPYGAFGVVWLARELQFAHLPPAVDDLHDPRSLVDDDGNVAWVQECHVTVAIAVSIICVTENQLDFCFALSDSYRSIDA